MDPLDKNTKLMVTRQTRFGDCVHWIHSDGSIGHAHWTSEMDPIDPLDNFTDGHHVQWTSIGHDGSNGSIGLDSQLLWPFYQYYIHDTYMTGLLFTRAKMCVLAYT